MPVEFKNPDTAAQYTNTVEKDHGIIVMQCKPAYRGKLSDATPEACEQMIAEGVPYVKKKEAQKTVNPVKP